LEFARKTMFRTHDRAGATICGATGASVRSCAIRSRAWRMPMNRTRSEHPVAQQASNSWTQMAHLRNALLILRFRCEWGDVIPKGDLLQLGRHRCNLLSQFTGVEHQPIWEWALIQCVSNGLSLRRIGFDDSASVQLAMAETWAANGDFVGP